MAKFKFPRNERDETGHVMEGHVGGGQVGEAGQVGEVGVWFQYL